MAALRAGVDSLVGKMLPSAWSPTGRGWQEHWTDAAQAGFYASCDGIIVLAGARAFTPVPFDRAVEQVFTQHLTRFVANDITPPDERAGHERAVALTTTMKLAKYLQAFGAAGRPTGAAGAAKQVAGKLLREGRRLKTGWSYVIGDGTPAVVPTMEVVLGLRAAGLDDVKVTSAACEALANIDWQAQPGWSIHDVVMWFVATTELRLVPQPVGRARVMRCLSQILASNDAFQYPHWSRRFVNRRGDANDYYSANVTLLLAAAIARLVGTGALDEMYMRLVESAVVPVATALLAAGVFQTTDKLYFWEHAQALFLLTRYLETLEAIAMPLSSGMFISPRHFTNTRFVYDPKLVTILMPFAPDWANDVYAAFTETIKAARLKAWRADQENRDDVIMQTIWRRINEARLVIADCTGKNPNVFYELGIAHTVGKPVFICAQDRNDIPFDVASIRSPTYSINPSGVAKLKSQLAKFIEEVKKA